MKKFAGLFTVVLLFGFTGSCTSPGSNIGASPSAKTSPTVKPTAAPTPAPTPVPTPTPEPLPLEQQVFNVEINLEGALVGFTQIDEGFTQVLPLKIDLNGGKHKLFVADLIACKLYKDIIVDKDHTKFIYSMADECK